MYSFTSSFNLTKAVLMLTNFGTTFDIVILFYYVEVI